MNSRSPALTFILIVTAVLIGLALVYLLLPIMIAAGGVLLAILPLIFTIWGLASCLLSPKPAGTKTLWVIIIILAPLLGPLLWFVWGKRNT